jgi:hypothetical protein
MNPPPAVLNSHRYAPSSLLAALDMSAPSIPKAPNSFTSTAHLSPEM